MHKTLDKIELSGLLMELQLRKHTSTVGRCVTKKEAPKLYNVGTN